MPRLLSAFGEKGLYTSSLFHFAPGFLKSLGPALELGRSFVRPEYQRQFSPLLLLWKGIGAYAARHPEYSTMIGAVSVSNDYSAASREIIVRYFESRQPAFRWNSAVRARRPLRRKTLAPWEIASLCSVLPGVEGLSAPIGDLEPDGKGLPILLRQYSNLGGELLAFSVDRQFSDCLDGFVLIDLRRTNPHTLSRYMGREAAQRFFASHSGEDTRVA